MPTVNQLRDDLAGLHTLAGRDLRRLWRQVGDAVQARDTLTDLLPLLIRSYGAAAATIAADWYDDLRDDLGVPGRFTAVPAVADDLGVEVSARWAVAPLFQAEPDWRRTLVLADGVLQRRVANAARDTISGSAVADPRARGWQRAGVGSCAFCAMLIGRGAVYSEATVDFASHDHCNCYAVPAFGGRPVPVKPYTPSERVATDADRARVRAYLADHHAG